MTLAKSLALAILLGATAANAQGDEDAGSDAGVPTGVLTRAPALLKQVVAAFPPEAADAGVAGTVVMEVDLGPDGKVTDVKVTGPAGFGFDEAAVAAVRQFEFSPAEVDGVPAPVRLSYSYEFLFRPVVTEQALPDGGTENFRGTIIERGTRLPLEGARVAVKIGVELIEAETDADGGFVMKDVPLGTHEVIVLAQDHARFESLEEFKEGLATEVLYYVRKQSYGAYETVVRAQRERKEVAQVSLRQEEIRLIPGTNGDAFKVVQNLPGVARSPFGIGLLVVRGGKPWDTRTYVDGALIPLLFHFGGLNATYQSSLLEELTFEPGNFSAEWGRNIGGLVRARSRSPSQEGIHGYVDLNLLDASALIESPIANGWSIAVAGRRSYVDVTLPAAISLFAPDQNVLGFTVAPRYFDYQLKVEKKLSGNERFAIQLFGAQDEIRLALPNPAFDPEGRGDFGTLLSYNRLTINYSKRLSDQLRWEASGMVGYDKFDFGVGKDLFVNTSIFPASTRQAFELSLPEQNLDLSFGFDMLGIPYRSEVQSPPRFKLNQIPDPFVSRRLTREDSLNLVLEPALYVEAVWKPLPSLKLVPGIRADYDVVMADGWIDPRLAVLYSLGEATTLKGGIGLFHQPPDYRQGFLSPTFGNPDLLPEAAAHYSVGGEHAFTDAISLNVQLFYKSIFHEAIPTLAAPVGTDTNVDDIDLNYESRGKGRVYGAELLLRHQLTKNFFGWISYSLSRAERQYGISGDALKNHPLDQPHNLVALASYKFPYDIIFGAKIRYASGALNTPYVGSIYDANGNYYYPLIGELFSRRLPAFFQLDARLDKRFIYDRYVLAIYADVQNVTNRRNVESVSYNYDYTREQYLYGLPILPSLGVRGEW